MAEGPDPRRQCVVVNAVCGGETVSFGVTVAVTSA